MQQQPQVYEASAWMQKTIAQIEAGNVSQAVLWLRATGSSGVRALEAFGFDRVLLGRVAHINAAGEVKKQVPFDVAVFYWRVEHDRCHQLFKR